MIKYYGNSAPDGINAGKVGMAFSVIMRYIGRVS